MKKRRLEVDNRGAQTIFYSKKSHTEKKSSPIQLFRAESMFSNQLDSNPTSQDKVNVFGPNLTRLVLDDCC